MHAAALQALPTTKNLVAYFKAAQSSCTPPNTCTACLLSISSRRSCKQQALRLQQQYSMAALLASFAAPLATVKVEPRVARPIFHLAPAAPRGWINDPNGAQRQQHDTCTA
jgi:hypothetical protein